MLKDIGSVIYTVDDEGLAWITLNRPERRNALGGTLREDLVTAFGLAAEDPAVRVVALRGEGAAFCAGGDVKELLAAATAPGGRPLQERLAPRRDQALLAVAECPKPVIAAVQGPALGAGMNLALAADIRIASTEASFSQSFVRRGMVPDYAGTYFLPRAVGLSKALELMYTADSLGAEQALHLGLVSQVVAPAQLIEVVTCLAHRICLGAPVALRLLKAAVLRGAQGNVHDALERERAAQNVCFETEDAREGLRAFAEKRAPVFVGR